MGMYDESWCASCGTSITYTDNEDAMCGDCATEIGTEFAESLITFIQIKHDEHEYALSELVHKHESGELYSDEDAGMMDYHEGAVEALSVVLNKAKEMFQSGF